MYLIKFLNPCLLKLKPLRWIKKKTQKEIKHKEACLMRKSSLFFISIYQSQFSIWMGGACRFYPSCSDYASLVYKNHSFLRASFFVLKRLLSCHPLGPRWREEPEIQKFLEKR